MSNGPWIDVYGCGLFDENERAGARATTSQRDCKPGGSEMRRLDRLGSSLIAVVGAIGWGAAYGIREGRKGTTFSALFDASVGLYPGSDVQILGVPVGEVTVGDPEPAST